MADSQPTRPPFPILEGVRFADIPDFPGYAASDDGRIWSCRSPAGIRNLAGIYKTWWHERSARTLPNGYRQIFLSRDGKSHPRYVHRLVLEAFVGPCPARGYGCHDDGTRDNNRLLNLRWDTPKGNSADKLRHGTYRAGASHHSAVYSEAVVAQIKELTAAGKGRTEIARELGVGFRYVSRVALGHRRSVS